MQTLSLRIKTLVIASVLAFSAATSAQTAPNDAQIEADHRRAIQLRAAHRDEEARVIFERLWQQTHEPRALARLALAEHALGLHPQSEAHLVEALSHQTDPWIAQNSSVLDPVLQQLRAAQGIAVLTIQCATPNAAVFINGRNAGSTQNSIRVAPGSITFEVRAAGFVSVSRTVELRAGATHSEELTLAPVPATTNTTTTTTAATTATTANTSAATMQSTQSSSGSTAHAPPTNTPVVAPVSVGRVLAWTTAGVGVALVATGAAAWVVGQPAANEWNGDGCVNQLEVGDGPCQRSLSTARTMGWLRGVGFVGGGIAAVAATILFITSSQNPVPNRPQSTRRLVCAPNLLDSGLSCAGVF
jgi:hypothetical protein